MRRSDDDNEEQLLFDLPLDPKAAGRPAPAAPAAPPEPRSRAARPRPEPPPAAPTFLAEEEDPEDLEVTEDADDRVRIGSRLAAGGADLLIHGAVMVLLLVGSRSLGVRPTLDDAPAFGVFLLVFSFLYTVVPLAFWGHTLGMAWAGLIAHNRDGEPLTFDQTARRWFGAVLTVATAGLPLLAALRGRSLADLLSGSMTYSTAAPAILEPERSAG